MNQDKLIELAKQSGFFIDVPYEPMRIGVFHQKSDTELQRFCELVRNEALEDAAKVCDTKHAIRSADGFPREASSARALAKELRSMKS